jgi:hypothetical protein
MEFRRAFISEYKKELENLVDDFWEETTVYNQKYAKINWTVYENLEESGNFVLYIAEEDDKLCGYNCYVVMPCVNNTDILQADTAGLFLVQDKRGGRNARNFLIFSEEQLKNLGVISITAGVLPKRNYAPLLEYLGYSVAETMYIKMVN